MLRNLDDINGADISATDGQIGQVKDFYFDDDAWAVRYFVVETGSWLNTRRVLVPPFLVTGTLAEHLPEKHLRQRHFTPQLARASD